MESPVASGLLNYAETKLKFVYRAASLPHSISSPQHSFACRGYETITQTEESVTRLFAAQGIRILRQERAPIRLRGETLNLIGVDDSLTELRVVAPLVMPDTVNILLSHDPSAFDRAV